jgi:carbon monoxide dehydrogenase subunit G
VELEKTLIVAAPLPRLWRLLLDPKVMAGCVPGTQSVEVVSDVEYLAVIKIKISFIAASFKVRTKIVESKPFDYLRMEGSGEDSLAASSMTQSSELFLTDIGGGKTQIRIKAKANVLGRLGSFGLSVMKTKADRMWEEFGANFSAVVARSEAIGNGQSDALVSAPAEREDMDRPRAVVLDSIAQNIEPATTCAQQAGSAKAKWWQRFMPSAAASSALQPLSADQRRPNDIYVEFHRPNGVIKVLWPASAAPEAAQWLKDLM